MTLFELVASLTLDTKDFSNAVNGAEAEGKTLAQRLGADADSIKSAFGNAFSISIGQLMADGFKAALGAAWDFIEGSVEVAASAEETNNKIDAIFGDKAAEVHKWANTTKEQFGISSTAAKQYASQLAGIMSSDSLELSSEQIFEMSTSLVELAGDLASFHNYDLDTVWFKILSGMRGETEAIEDLGIDMRATAVGAMFGITGKAFGQLSPQEQLLMRYQYLMANTTVAQGDFARTSESYSNQLKLFEQNMLELQATIGESLLPTLTGLLQIMNSLFVNEGSASEGVKEVKDAFAGELATAESTATKALALVEALEELEKASEDASSTEAWSMLINELERTIPGIGDLINEQTGKIEGGASALRDYIDNWKELAITASKQKALQSLMEEYNTKSTQLATLINEQMVADKLEVDYAENQKEYEQAFADTIVAGMKAKGFDQETIDEYLKNAADLGAGMTFGQILMGESVDSALAGSQLGFGQSSLYSLLSLWEAGGGTKDSFAALATAWGVATTERNKYEKVNNAEAIAELEAFLQSKETELDALASILDVLYGDLYDTPSEPTDGSETTEEPPAEETTTETDESEEVEYTAEYYEGLDAVLELEKEAEAESAEAAAAAEEAANAAQQVTETAAQMTADANSTDAMLITVLQGLPGNIATAVGGMSVTLDGDTIVGYVSAAMAREARGSKNTGG